MSFKKLLESNIEKAEIVLAVKGEIVDKLQRQAEVINNMGVDVLGPLLDRIKAEHGLEAAESFKNNISGYLTHAVQTLMDVKDKISTETLKLTGDIAGSSDIADIAIDDNGADEDINVDIDGGFDMEDDAKLADDVATDILSEPVPSEREMKESKQRIGLIIESVSGKIGKKYFESQADIKPWLVENKNKIKRIIKVEK